MTTFFTPHATIQLHRRFRRSGLVTVLVILTAATSSAQERLTLIDATARALARNHDVRIERLKVSAADAEAERARGEYDPQLRFDIGLQRQREPITSLFSGAPEGDVAATFNGFGSSVSLTQRLKSGGALSVTSSTGRQSTNSSLTLFSPAYTTSLGVELRQPLLRNRAIDPARVALHVTALDRDRSGARFDAQVLTTVADVEKAYWALVAARREVAVRRESVALAEQQRADTQVRIEARTIAPSDLAQPIAEVERRRGDLLRAQELAARTERALKYLMLDDRADPLWSTELEPVDAPESPVAPVDLKQSLATAAASRPEVTEIATEISQRDVIVDAAGDALKPTLDVFARYIAEGLSGSRNDEALTISGLPSTVPSSLQGGAGTSWQSLFGGDFSDLAVGVSIGIPIGRHAARGQLGTAVAERRQALARLEQARSRIDTEVRNAVTAVELAANRIDAANAGLVAAETQLRAEQDRFAAGVTTNFFVLTRQSELATAQLARIAAITDHRVAVTELARATGVLVRERGIQVDRRAESTMPAAQPGTPHVLSTVVGAFKRAPSIFTK